MLLSMSESEYAPSNSTKYAHWKVLDQWMDECFCFELEIEITTNISSI